jgi:hypothetical protein
MARALHVLALLCGTAYASPSQNPQAALDQGRTAYARHEYKEVENTIAPLLKNNELGTEDSIAEAHRLLALSYFFQKRTDDAQKEVKALLRIKPDFHLDSFVEPPVAVSFFENIRKEQKQLTDDLEKRRLDEEERLRKDEERRRAEARRKAERIYLDREVVKHSRLVAALPFGIGQIQNGNKKLAVMFGVTEAVFGALSLATWISIQQIFPNAQYQPFRDASLPGNKDLATALTATQVASGAAFWGLVVAGIIEAEVRYVPQVVKVKELPSAPKPKATWLLGPILSPTFYGVGAQGAF